MVSKLKKPRRVMMLVKAGSAVDAFIDKLVRKLEEITFPLCIAASLIYLPVGAKYVGFKLMRSQVTVCLILRGHYNEVVLLKEVCIFEWAKVQCEQPMQFCQNPQNL